MQAQLLQTIFYFFAGLCVLSAFLVVTQKNPVRAVLFLVLCFIASSVLWLIAKAEFLALILVLVYVGAVMTLFLFVVMMLNIDVESGKAKLRSYLPLAMLLIGLLSALLLKTIPATTVEPVSSSTAEQSVNSPLTADKATSTATNNRADSVVNETTESRDSQDLLTKDNTEALGLVLYTDYVFAFELAAVILLVAIIAAISLVHRPTKRSKQQNVVDQLLTDPRDRLEIVKMKAEKA